MKTYGTNMTKDEAPASPKDAALKLARQLLWRYRHETPMGHQPHMICHQADEAFERIDAALAQPVQELPTLEQQLAKASADMEKANADWYKASDDYDKARDEKRKAVANWHKAYAEVKRIEQLIKEQTA